LRDIFRELFFQESLNHLYCPPDKPDKNGFLVLYQHRGRGFIFTCCVGCHCL